MIAANFQVGDGACDADHAIEENPFCNLHPNPSGTSVDVLSLNSSVNEPKNRTSSDGDQKNKVANFVCTGLE